MAKILYISCHEVLERDEVSLLHELGHDVFSYQGAYMYPDPDPQHTPYLKRPGIPGMIYHAELASEALKYPKNNLPQTVIDWCDIIIFMHNPEALMDNWERIKHKKVIFRSIGQNVPSVENTIRKARYGGLRIIRMSPKEENITGYVGSDLLIRFYKDPEEWNNWTGHVKRVINFTQSLKGRRVFCHYDHIMPIIQDFPSLIYGSGNEDLGPLNGGELPYELMKGVLRDNRCFIYAGTWPSPYTLSLIEAMTTGIPVVTIGKKLAEEVVPHPDYIDFYEVADIIKNGENGFLSNSINDLRGYIHQLLEDEQLANRISKEGRKTAIRLFNKEYIQTLWKKFLEGI